eukprot:4939656-Pyramimonas_sp.AAC.1
MIPSCARDDARAHFAPIPCAGDYCKLLAFDSRVRRCRFGWEDASSHLRWTMGHNHAEIAKRKNGPLSPGG